MAKTDFKTDRKDLYAPPAGRFVEVTVPPMTFVAIDGHGDPNTSEDYRHAVEALFAVSFAAKFISKRELDRDYVVAPLEGLWSAKDPAAFTRKEKNKWSWTVMIRQPDWLSPTLIEQAHQTAAKKRLAAAPLVRFLTFEEGLSVQTLHVGSYDEEGPLLDQLHRTYLPAHKLMFNGRHHEVYLNDPRKTAPAKLKVVLRQPVAARRE
ncbi:MAG: GyrI-like domain-containing protein [Actinomycetota bacterium]|nr:GyrI-like domain-containing protein [Actinomycetota bacterium]